MPTELNKQETRVIAQRIAGTSERAIAKKEKLDLAEVRRILCKFAAGMLDDDTRKTTLALELGRIDAMQEKFYRKAIKGDLSSALFVTRLIERRCLMLGLHAPQQAVLQIIDSTTQRKSTTDRLEAALAALIEEKSGPIIEGKGVPRKAH